MYVHVHHSCTASTMFVYFMWFCCIQNCSYLSCFATRKVLYAMVQLLLDVAVLGDNDESAVTKHVNQMIDFLQLVLYAFEDHSVPKSIISQFFGNLFCFISGSLVNLLLEGEDSGDDTKVLSYTCASQLQKDFDLFQGWSMGVALEQEATKYLSPLMSILSFLSTPEEDLIRVSIRVCVCVVQEQLLSKLAFVHL